MDTIHLHNYEAFLLDYSEGNLSEAEIAQLKLFLLEHPELEIDLEDFNFVYLAKDNQHFDFKESLKKSEIEVPDEQLINYLEGNLSLDEKISFEIKIAGDPELSGDLEDYKKTILTADHKETLESKSLLQKTEDDLILNNRVVAYFENQLTLSEKQEFENKIQQNSTLQNELVIFSKTILIADNSIIYPDKESLKKETRIIAFFNMRTLGSMAAALLLLFGFAFVYNYYGSKKSVSSELAIHTKPERNIQKDLANSTATLITKEIQVAKEDEIVTRVKKDSFKAPVKNLPAKENFQENSVKTNDKESIEIAVTKENVDKNTLQAKEDKTEVASVKNIESIDTTNKKNYLLVAEDVTEENELIELKESAVIKRGLWKRAVQLAKQANKLGVKSIDGQENSKNDYRLSFNSFSVEKK